MNFVDATTDLYDAVRMREFVRQILIGAGSIFLGPTGAIPRPAYTITLPPETSTMAIAGDFSRVAGDMARSIEKVEREGQLELSI